jgi:hypothetical protein
MSLFPSNARAMRVRIMQVGAAGIAATMIAGCGSTYRPVVTPLNPNGPPAQVQSYAVVVSSPSPTAPGVATVLDYAGDTVLVQAQIGPGPLDFAVNESGSFGYTVNSDGTLTNFPISQTDPQEKHITYSTLPTTAQVVGLFAPVAGLWGADLTGNNIDVLTSSPETYKLSIPVAPTPISVSGPGFGGQHLYSLSLNSSTTPLGSAITYDNMICNTAPSTASQTGEADSLELASYTVSAQIPLGKCPVYGIQSSDNRRFFVLNRGSDTVTVINSQNNTIDACSPFTNQNGQLVTCHPTLPLSTTALAATGITPPNCNLAADPTCGGMTTTAGPVYAELNAATSQLVVSNYDGGTVSIIDVSLDQYGNDSPTFGTTFTVHVGNTATPNPASVTVLYDGSRAYTANQGDCAPDCTTSPNGTVSIVNLSSHTLEKTLSVTGLPRTVVSTQNSLYGKVYVAAPNTPYVTIVRTDQDIVDTTVLVQGNVVDVRTTTQNGVSGNANNTSRRPGAGQPCYLPPALETAQYGAGYTLADCQTLP